MIRINYHLQYSERIDSMIKFGLFGYAVQIKKCDHKNPVFIKNLFGDSINTYSTKYTICRSLWKCPDCGKLIKSPELNLKECYSPTIKK